MRALLVALLLAAPVVAGCLSPGGAPQASPTVDAGTYDAIEAAIGAPIQESHDHGDPKLHQGHVNLERVAAMTGYADPAQMPPQTSFVETAVKGGYAYICRSGPDEGLVIFDVHDIEHPKQVGYVHLDAGFEPDVEVTDDGHWAFWETQRLPGEGASPTDPTSLPGAAPYGIHIVDISDKAHPKWVGFTPVAPNGPHSITYARIKDQDYVFAGVYSWQYVGTSVGTPTLAPPMTQRLEIYKLDTSLPVAQLTEVASYIDPAAVEANPVTPKGGLMPHDVSISVHPVTKKTYAYVAYWDLGVVTLDVTDPASPTLVSKFADFGPAPYKEVHMARIFNETIDGKVVMVVEPEIGGEPDSGYITFADATDPAHVTYLSSWRIPGNITSGGGSLGPHYFDVRDGRVAMASYHAGFWIMDVHDAANLMHPRTVAYAEVNATGQALPGPAGALGGGASAFDAWWADETHVVGGDVHAGLVVFRYTGPAPAAV